MYHQFYMCAREWNLFFHAIILCVTTQNMCAINSWNILFIIIHVQCETVTMCRTFNSMKWLTAVTIHSVSVRYCIQLSYMGKLTRFVRIFLLRMRAILSYFVPKKNFSGLNRFRTVVQPSNSQKFNGLTVRNNRSLIKIDSIGSKLWPQLRNG